MHVALDGANMGKIELAKLLCDNATKRRRVNTHLALIAHVRCSVAVCYRPAWQTLTNGGAAVPLPAQSYHPICHDVGNMRALSCTQ